MKAFIVVMILIAFLAPAAHGAILYVGPGEAYATIQAGIDAASDGDVIIVRDGVYTGIGNRDINFKGKAIYLTSERGPEFCVVNAQGTDSDPHAGFLFRSGETNTSAVDGFTITGANGGGIVCDRSSPTIRRNWVRTCSSYGIICSYNCAPLIADNIISENLRGLYFFSYCSPVIVRNLIVNNEGRAMKFYHMNTPTVENCTIAGNNISEKNLTVHCWTSSLTMTNCILRANGSDYTIYLATEGARKASAKVSYSDIEGGTAKIGVAAGCILTWGIGNIDADPLFADPANGDYHLKSRYGRWSPTANGGAGWVLDDVTSPCIDTGDPATAYANEPQPNGCRVNMGAYGNTHEASKGAWLPGDANLDCRVDVLDLIVIRNLFMHDAESGDNWRGDVNEDGQINVLDLIFSRNHMGTSRP